AALPAAGGEGVAAAVGGDDPDPRMTGGELARELGRAVVGRVVDDDPRHRRELLREHAAREALEVLAFVARRRHEGVAGSRHAAARVAGADSANARGTNSRSHSSSITSARTPLPWRRWPPRQAPTTSRTTAGSM